MRKFGDLFLFFLELMNKLSGFFSFFLELMIQMSDLLLETQI
jgi:hypothetical protein